MRRFLSFGHALVSALTLVAASLPVVAQADFRVTQIAREPESILLRWSAPEAGLAFTVQVRDDAAQGLWLPAETSAPWPVDALEWRGPATQPLRFYRVLAVPKAERGKLLSNSSKGAYAASTLTFLFTLGGIPLTAVYGADTYKLVYETVDAHGVPTQASGLLVVPQQPGKPVPVVSYQHGTLARKIDAPSGMTGSESSLGLALASQGYLAVLPDYLGLGDSPGVQTYHHAASEATAAVDMLRAARTFCASKNISLNAQLFLCGYSQGGHATMALHRELETYHADEFPVTACAPMAGAYDLSGATAEDFLSGRSMPNPYYFALLMASYQEVYGLAPALADLLAPAYKTILPPLLDGQHSADEIDAKMPASPIQILEPSILQALQQDPNHWLRRALTQNDVYRWKPRAAMRLYHCDGDQDVPFANAQVAHDYFAAEGLNVELINTQPGADHGACAQPTLLNALGWFNSLRQ
jgi:pimeloyl-ACP methyl ester carboxylesterase